MDCYAATREIRKDPRFETIPVIAMTANAMAGDREKALQAGRNDRVAKPIDVTELFEVLGRLVDVRQGRETSALHAGEAPGADLEEFPGSTKVPGVDAASGLARVGGKVAVYRRILRSFATSHADTPTRIRAALAGADYIAAEREVHTFKGVAGNIGATAVHAAAKRLEEVIGPNAEDGPEDK